MLIAEELLLTGTSPQGRDLLGSHRHIAVGGALLAELALHERLDVDDRGRLHVVDSGSTGEPLLDEALALFADKEGKKPKNLLAGVGKKVQQPLLERMARHELVRAEPVRALGLTLTTRWPVVGDGPRDAVLADLTRVVTRAQEPDARTGALISLLHAVDALHRVVTRQLRPGVSNREVRLRGKEVTKGRWAPEAVTKAVQEATAAMMVAITAGAGAASSS